MILRCIECRRESRTGRHWRAYLADDPRDDDPPEVALSCPSCAEREFGRFQEFGGSVDETVELLKRLNPGGYLGQYAAR